MAAVIMHHFSGLAAPFVRSKGTVSGGVFKNGLLYDNFNESEVNKMTKNRKQTSKSIATKASQILKDGRYSKESKSVAGSALAQTKPGKRK